MAVVISRDDCTGCESCIDECPTECLVMGDDGIVKLTDPDECTECGTCIDECSSEALAL